MDDPDSSLRAGSKVTEDWIAPQSILGKADFVRGVDGVNVINNFSWRRTFRFGSLDASNDGLVGYSQDGVGRVDVCVH